MRKCLVALGALALAACGDQKSQANAGEGIAQGATPRTPFEFRGLKPGETTVKQAQNLGQVEECNSYVVEKVKSTSCRLTKYQIGDVPTGGSTANFEDDTLDWISVEFSTDYFERMLEQTRQVYGEPCDASSERLQNGFGAKFSGDEVSWCFAQGTLTVRRHSENNYRLAEFDFFQARPEQAAKTYDANSL